MCGIAGVMLRRADRGPARARRARRDGRRAQPPRSRRVRDLPRPPCRPGPRPALDHRPGHRASSRSRTNAARCGSRSTARSSTTSSCARSLSARGHQFRTRSDTEVIVHAYEEWGAEAFRRFNGQWAVGLWDSERRELVLARDPVRRASALRRRTCRAPRVRQRGEGALRRRPDAAAASRPRGPRRDSSRSGRRWRRKRSLPASKRWSRAPCASTPTRACAASAPTSPAFPADHAGEFAGSLDDAVDEVRTALADATRLRMLRADVPVGSYLSGGLDSSLIAALGLQAKGSNFSTFSLRFEDAEYDETVYQRMMAERLGSDHHEVVVSRGDIARVFPDVIRHTERPILRTAPAPLFLLSKLVHDAGIKVVLTGEGADEMFAGYDLFREAKVRRFWGAQPTSQKRPRLLERLYPYLERSPVAQRAMARQFFGRGLDRFRDAGFGHDPRWAGASALKRLFSPAVREHVAGRDAKAQLLAAPARRVPRVELAGAGPVSRSAHAALGLPAVVAGRPHADGAFGGRPLPVPRSPRGRAGRIAAAGLQAAGARREARAQARGGRRGAAGHSRPAEAAVSRARRAVVRYRRGARTGSRRWQVQRR